MPARLPVASLKRLAMQPLLSRISSVTRATMPAWACADENARLGQCQPAPACGNNLATEAAANVDRPISKVLSIIRASEIGPLTRHLNRVLKMKVPITVTNSITDDETKRVCDEAILTRDALYSHETRMVNSFVDRITPSKFCLGPLCIDGEVSVKL